jgi:uncharacterized protein YciI
MKNYLFRLIPPRATFPADISAAEAALMQQHAAYWSGLMQQGKVIAFGPVADPRGAWGVGLLQLDDGDDAHALGAADPAILANAGFSFEVHPMPKVVVAGRGVA